MNNFTNVWPQRPWILALWLSIIGLAIHFTTDGIGDIAPAAKAWREALTTFLFIAGATLAFSLEQRRWLWAVVFAVFWGLVLAAIAWWASGLREYSSYIGWQLWSGVLAAAIAIPLFQTVRDQGCWSFPYPTLHGYAWSDAVCWFAAWLFVAIAFFLAFLLGELFGLIGINFIKELLKDNWFTYTFIGASFGASLGVLKEHDRIVGSIQSLVMTVLSILTPALAIALALFLISLPFTGLQPLWDATDATTPILLSCAAGAVLLINATIRNHEKAQADNRILVISAMVLSVCILPLALIGWVSMQQRISQYGVTPDRLWVSITIIVAFVYGLAYLVSLLIGRHNWAVWVRNWNTRIAFALCVLMLALSLPFADFGKWSANAQLERFTNGQTAPEDFDFVAFGFHFGPHGRILLEQLKTSENSKLVQGATIALTAENRWQAQERLRDVQSKDITIATLKVFPFEVDLPAELRKHIEKQNTCLSEFCALYWEQGASQAQLISGECNHLADEVSSYKFCPPEITYLTKIEGDWQSTQNSQNTQRRYIDTRKFFATEQNVERARTLQAIEAGRLEVRTVKRRQLYLGDEPIGEPFE